MPTANFSSFSDGLDRDQRSRDHFIANTNLENGRLRPGPSASDPKTSFSIDIRCGRGYKLASFFSAF